MSRYMPLIELDTVHVEGSARELGLGQGESLRSLIVDFVKQRRAAARAYLMERKIPSEAFLQTGARCMEIFKDWDPDGYAEHIGIAEGAGVDPTVLYATTNMTDIRDIIAYGQGAPNNHAADTEGCSSVLIPGSRTKNGHHLAAQTWDLNPPDVAYVVAIHRRPSNSPETWSVTCAGCLTLMGMNEHGLAVGTNNIKTRPVQHGVGYLSLLHRAIRCEDRHEAAAMLADAPRAAAHVFWFADAEGADEHESSARHIETRPLESVAICRTNHCLADSHIEREAEPPIESSYKRLDRLTNRLDTQGIDIDTVRDLFASREDGIYSISRFEEDDQGTATNACLITEPTTKTLWACRGPSQHGKWVELAFGAASTP